MLRAASHAGHHGPAPGRGGAEPATAACPRARPPSLGGTTRWVRTWNPAVELATGQAEEQDVLEHPAAQGDQSMPVRCRTALGGVDDHVGHCDMEAGGHGAGADTAPRSPTMPRSTGPGSIWSRSRRSGTVGLGRPAAPLRPPTASSMAACAS